MFNIYRAEKILQEENKANEERAKEHIRSITMKSNY